MLEFSNKNIGVARKFDWEGDSNHKSYAMMILKIWKENFIVGQRYHRMEDWKP